MALDLSLRCSSCKAFAYHDEFQGEYDGEYTCSYCIRLLNQKVIDAAKEKRKEAAPEVLR